MAEPTRIELGEGLAIYKQKASKNWYVYLYHGGKRYPTVSTKTADQKEAQKIAYSRQYAVENGITQDNLLTITSNKVKTLCKDLKKDFEANPRKSYKKDYVPVLGQISDLYGSLTIKDLDRKVIKDYLSETAKSKTRLRIRTIVLNRLFDHAIEERVMKERDRPTFPRVDVKGDEDRPAFKSKQIKTMSDKFPAFIAAPPKRLSKQIRCLLKHYIEFMTETGIRPGEEMNHLLLSDGGGSLKKGADRGLRYINVTKGKVHGKKRTDFRPVTLSRKALSVLDSLVSELHGYKHNYKALCAQLTIDQCEDFYLFRLPSEGDQRITALNQPFDQLLAFCDIDKEKSELVLYSARHTYITNKLMEGVDINLVATQCGTSVAMIERYYSKLKSIDRGFELID